MLGLQAAPIAQKLSSLYLTVYPNLLFQNKQTNKQTNKQKQNKTKQKKNKKQKTKHAWTKEKKQNKPCGINASSIHTFYTVLM